MLLSWPRRDKKLTTIVTGDNDENGIHDTAHLIYYLAESNTWLAPFV